MMQIICEVVPDPAAEEQTVGVMEDALQRPSTRTDQAMPLQANTVKYGYLNPGQPVQYS